VALLDKTIEEVRNSPLCSDAVGRGGRSAVLRYLEAAQWKAEPTKGKRVSDYFIDTLRWRSELNVDTILERASTFEYEAASGKLFVRGSSLLGRPLIWLHVGRENNGADPEANIQFLIYTVVSKRPLHVQRKCGVAVTMIGTSSGEPRQNLSKGAISCITLFRY